MKIAIAGASGFIGKNLIKTFLEKNWQIIEINRKDFSLTQDEFIEKIADSDCVINLAGAPILRRWTFSYKKVLFESRIITTRKIRLAIAAMKNKPQLFISTSAVGFYPEGGPFSESDRSYFPSFLADLCRDWENEALLIENDCRLVIFRFGVVLDKSDGALTKMLPMFKMGIGGKIGNGQQAQQGTPTLEALPTLPHRKRAQQLRQGRRAQRQRITTPAQIQFLRQGNIDRCLKQM